MGRSDSIRRMLYVKCWKDGLGLAGLGWAGPHPPPILPTNILPILSERPLRPWCNSSHNPGICRLEWDPVGKVQNQIPWEFPMGIFVLLQNKNHKSCVTTARES